MNCPICGVQFTPRVSWQKTCGSPECMKRWNAKRVNDRAALMRRAASPKPIEHLPDPVPMSDIHFTRENLCLLIAAMFENAWLCKDWAWFGSDNAKLYYDFLGIDRESVLAKVRKVRYPA